MANGAETPGEREQARLDALDSYDILDTPAEEAFDRITRLVRSIFDVPISTVTFLDGHRQWFKSYPGLPNCESERGPALCNFAVQQGRPLVVQDTLQDSRFESNPFVVGEPHIRFYAGVPLRSPEGHDIGTLCAIDTVPKAFDGQKLQILADLARVVMDQLELRRLASTDSLTGVLSRRAFRDEAERAIARAFRYAHDLTCIVFDLDRFKQINDQNGHDIGDVVLREAVGACRRNLRKSDVLARMGGEEFAILLPHTGVQAALAVSEKIRRAIAQLRIAMGTGTTEITASFGVAGLDRSISDIDGLLKRADLALYEAKGDGRNRCVIWQGVEEVKPETRRRVFKAGKISFNLGRSTINCTVRSLSEVSATLDVLSTAGIPDRFKLAVEADNFSRTCSVSSKRDKHLEVEFI